MAIHIGCGSWSDQEYVGVLYPRGLAAGKRLGMYSQWFDRIELNSIYHSWPSLKYVNGWVEQTPPGFIFDVKMPKVFSEDPALAAQGSVPERLLSVVQPMVAAKKFGTFLLTLAPSVGPRHLRLEQLDALVEKLQPHRLAIEFRNRGFVTGEARAATLEYFRTRKLVWVALDLPLLEANAILPPIDEVTCPDLAYIRLHGRNPAYLTVKGMARHEYDYTEPELNEIVGRIRHLASQARHVHVSVNTHAKAYAPKAAIALRRLLGQPVPASIPEAPTETFPK